MAELHFDIVFIDCGPSAPYYTKTLENQAMGGTESSCVKLAEEFGKMGLVVAVVKTSDPNSGIVSQEFEPIFGQYAFYMPESYLSRMDTRICIMLRGPLYINYFPKAKKYIWLHDLVDERIKAWQETLDKHRPTIVGVSRWHHDQIRTQLEYDHITYAYNPIQEDIYLEPTSNRSKVNKDLMIWASSPHKGLDEALGTFKKLHTRLPNLKLLIYNPGYVKGDMIINPGVLYYGATAQRHVIHNMKQALCVFYPSKFQETFGLVMAEANAVGCPVACYDSGALGEILNHPTCNDENDLLDNIEQWYTNGGPKVYGKEEFKTSRVAAQWLRIFTGVL